MYCEKCNTKVAQAIRICPKCGNRSFSEVITKNDMPSSHQRPHASSAHSLRNSSLQNPRPWIRFWARFFDWMFFGIFIGIIIGYWAPNSMPHETVLSFMILYLWIFGDAFCISKFGTTPGKKLFRISLTHKSGDPIIFSDALTRSGLVLWRGFALGLPIVYIITGIVAYNNLMKNGTTTWDSEGGYIVSHQKLGFERLIIIAGIAVAFSYLVYLSSESPNHSTYL